MSSSLLDIYSVVGNQIHEEIVKTEYTLKEEWWSAHRLRQERKLTLAIGAVPEKEPLVMPELPRLALGKAAARPVSETFGYTSSARESDLLVTSSEMHDYFRATGYWQRQARFRKKGLPSFYGRSLHSSSSDGTDYSTRRG
jgi:hypothetical protein